MTSGRPTASVAIAFRNPGQPFVDCLKSVFAQTFTDWELLLLDDRSTDASLALARGLSDPRVRVFSDGCRRGLPLRLNELVQLARGRYFFRMDADDIMHPDRLARQVEVLSDRNPLTVLGTLAYSLRDDGELLGLRKHPPLASQGFRVRRTFIHPTVAADRRWFLDNPYSEDPLYHRGQDAELWCRTRAASRFEILDEPLLYYRESSPPRFELYAATAASSIALLATRYRRPRLRFVLDLAKEVGKLFLYGLTAGTGLEAWITPRKFVQLPAGAQARAKERLALVRACQLPLSMELTHER